MEPLAELIRPWKLCSLAVGIGWLVLGSFYYRAPDWDVPISLIMASLAYLTAPWSMRVMVKRQWKRWPQMLVLTWLTVDGCYWLYWSRVNTVALELMREVNVPASLSLYCMFGLIWYYEGPLNALVMAARKCLAGQFVA